MPKLKIVNLKKEIEFSPVISLFNNLAMNGIFVFNKCGGKGICGMCRIKILTGQKKNIRKPNAAEKKHLTEKDFENGYRLACQTYSLKDLEVEIHGAKIKEN